MNRNVTANIPSDGVIGEKIAVPLWMSLTGLLICSFTASLNFAFLIFMIKNKNLRRRTGIYLIVCLCLSDAFAGTGGVVFSITYIIPGLPSNRPFCTFHMLLYITGIVQSIGQTFIISLHRFLVAKGVHWHWYLGKKHVLISMFVVIQVSFLSTIGLQEKKIPYCELSILYGKRYHYFALVAFIFAITFTVLIFSLYLISLCLIRKRFCKTDTIHVNIVATSSRQCWNDDLEGTRQSVMQSSTGDHRQKKMVKMYKTVGILLAVFFVLTVPIVIIMFLEFLGIAVGRQIRLPVAFLPLINSLLNPFIYTFRFEEVKREIREMALC